MNPPQYNPPAIQPQATIGSEIAAVTVASRLAEFWCDQPNLWFVQTEAVLAPQKLSDETRFNLVVSKLGKNVLEQVSDLLRDPPSAGKFDALKKRLLAVYEESESKQFEKLLNLELSEQKPSQLLRRMRDLARGKIDDKTISMLWMRLLPPSVKGVLAVTGTKDLDNNAEVADKILENIKSNEIAEVTPTPCTSSDLGDQVAKLTAQFQEFQRSYTPWRRPVRGNGFVRRGTSQSGSRDRRRSSSRENDLCYYHRNFKERARRCSSPCSWKNKNQGN